MGLRDAGRFGVMHFGAALVALGIGLLAALVMGMANPSGAAVDGRVMRIAQAASGGFSDVAFRAATADMDPAMLALARRYDLSLLHQGDRQLLTWQASPFAPTVVDPRQAEQINSALPFSTEANPAARAFRLRNAAALDQERALDCLTQAVYYEAGFEPEDGMRAVAQVVINRMRHPAFPKTICGVVYQGSDRVTGCQFSFTCDGALARQPAAAAWARSRKVAAAALDGAVMAAVGGATHYHTDYVAPYWAPRLFKVKQIGAHIFYRWPGSWGLPAAFNGRYAGAERPGIDPGGDPNRIDLDSLKLAGLEGVAESAQGAEQVLASLDVAQPKPIDERPLVAEDAIPASAVEEEPAKPAVVVPPRRPAAPPRLAMPG